MSAKIVKKYINKTRSKNVIKVTKQITHILTKINYENIKKLLGSVKCMVGSPYRRHIDDLMRFRILAMSGSRLCRKLADIRVDACSGRHRTALPGSRAK